MSGIATLRGKRVLVTGATGFIGGRLVEHLVRAEGAEVRALVRNFANAPRLARFAVEMVPGDLMAPDALARAVDGCDVVFHCAYGNGGDESARRNVTVKGTELLLDAALQHKVRRVVHTSTFSVYGDPPSGDLDEQASRTYTGSAYGDSKIDAEKLALSYCAKGLSVAVVQPTIVYGPFGSTWTVKPLQQLSTGRVILVNGGAGLCNAVYVDDVVAAMLRAAVLDQAHGESFLVSGPSPITWAEYFARHAALVPGSETVSMTAEEANKYSQSTETNQGLMAESLRVIRRELSRREGVLRERLSPNPVGRFALMAARATTVLPARSQAGAADDARAQAARPIHPLLPAKVRMFASTARARIDKAARLLGYLPQFDFDRGMAVTSAWAKWANLA
jgi:nucleoside-diphosphate-sugar epimerase